MSTSQIPTLHFDKAHSEITFQVRHLLSRVRGRFSDFEGTIVADEAAPEKSSVSLTIKAASVDTSEPQRDQHLRSADFFDVERFPVLTFASTLIARTGEGQFAVMGDLTIHGVTRKVTLPVSYLGAAKDPWGHMKHAFETELTINRKEFGLMWNAALETGGFLVGDEVKIGASIQAV